MRNYQKIINVRGWGGYNWSSGKQKELKCVDRTLLSFSTSYTSVRSLCNNIIDTKALHKRNNDFNVNFDTPYDNRIKTTYNDTTSLLYNNTRRFGDSFLYNKSLWSCRHSRHDHRVAPNENVCVYIHRRCFSGGSEKPSWAVKKANRFGPVLPDKSHYGEHASYPFFTLFMRGIRKYLEKIFTDIYSTLHYSLFIVFTPIKSFVIKHNPDFRLQMVALLGFAVTTFALNDYHNSVYQKIIDLTRYLELNHAEELEEEGFWRSASEDREHRMQLHAEHLQFLNELWDKAIALATEERLFSILVSYLYDEEDENDYKNENLTFDDYYTHPFSTSNLMNTSCGSSSSQENTNFCHQSSNNDNSHSCCNGDHDYGCNNDGNNKKNCLVIDRMTENTSNNNGDSNYETRALYYASKKKIIDKDKKEIYRKFQNVTNIPYTTFRFNMIPYGQDNPDTQTFPVPSYEQPLRSFSLSFTCNNLSGNWGDYINRQDNKGPLLRPVRPMFTDVYIPTTK